jgi:hypothetical protein
MSEQHARGRAGQGKGKEHMQCELHSELLMHLREGGFKSSRRCTHRLNEQQKVHALADDHKSKRKAWTEKVQAKQNCE